MGDEKPLGPLYFRASVVLTPAHVTAMLTEYLSKHVANWDQYEVNYWTSNCEDDGGLGMSVGIRTKEPKEK